jgi:hypothetical protein
MLNVDSYVSGLGLGNFDDPSSWAGKANDLWGSFTGTSAEVFLNEGTRKVNELKKPFQANFTSNPTSAINTYSKGLGYTLGQSQAGLNGASQTKTREGGKKSVADVKKAVQELDSFVTSNNQYSFQVVNVISATYPHGKHSADYTYKVYKVTKGKTSSKETSNTNTQTSQTSQTSFFGSGEMSGPSSQNVSQSNYMLYALVGAVVYFMTMGKKGNKRR